MSCELRDLPAKFPDAGTLVRELKSCADWRWKPSRGRGESAHTSPLNSVSHLVWQLVFHEMRPIQEFQVNIAPFTGTTNAASWDLALSLGRHQKHSFLLCNHNSLLRATHFLTVLLFFSLLSEEESKGQGLWAAAAPQDLLLAEKASELARLRGFSWTLLLVFPFLCFQGFVVPSCLLVSLPGPADE